VILACLASITVAGCAPLQVSRLGRQAKPNVQLPRDRVFGRQHAMWSRVEPGTAFSTGTTAAGCVGCQ
jgi:hypothetical protein